MKRRPRPLVTRLRSARQLLLEWRRTLYDSERSREPGPNLGALDEAAAHELSRFDAAREALTEAINLMKGPKA